jgi:hypothetical protein
LANSQLAPKNKAKIIPKKKTETAAVETKTKAKSTMIWPIGYPKPNAVAIKAIATNPKTMYVPLNSLFSAL